MELPIQTKFDNFVLNVITENYLDPQDLVQSKYWVHGYKLFLLFIRSQTKRLNRNCPYKNLNLSYIHKFPDSPDFNYF